ncbi:MAG: site-2 protease family protein [Haloferacaceae archaeon]
MRGVTLGRVFDIPVRLNFSFLLVLPLFAWLISGDVSALAGLMDDLLGTALPAEALATAPLRYALGLAAATGLFLSVLVHEFGHSLVARRYGYEIDSITLWLFGGVARLVTMPEDWRHELVIAVVGPVVSVVLGAGCYALLLAVPGSFPAAQFVVAYLAVTNVALAVFNMLPGFPMDGGRVLRAFLARNQPYARATKQAAEVGKGFAFLLGIVGLFANLLLIALAFFIYMGASSEAQQTAMRAAFEDVVVADVMTPRDRLDVVDEDTTVAELLDRMVDERHTGYPVMRGGELVGLVTLGDARAVREVERDAYTVGEVMTDDLAWVAAGDDVMRAIETMGEHDVGRLPVHDAEGALAGFVTRTDVMTAFEILQQRGTTDVSPDRVPDVDPR